MPGLYKGMATGPLLHSDVIWSLPEMDEFTQLTYLLHLIIVLKHKNGNAPLHQFVDHASAVPQTADHCIHTRSLDAVSAILVQNTEVIAASHHTENPRGNHALEDLHRQELYDKERTPRGHRRGLRWLGSSFPNCYGSSTWLKVAKNCRHAKP